MNDSQINCVNQRYKKAVTEDMVVDLIATVCMAFKKIRNILIEKSKKAGHEFPENAIRINIAVLSNAIYSYYYDVYRFRDFHGDTKKINKPKKAAYMIKWLLKSSPISWNEDSIVDEETVEILSSINELFALRVALAYAAIPAASIDPEMGKRLVYEFAFRRVDEGFLSFWFETFMNQHKIPQE